MRVFLPNNFQSFCGILTRGHLLMRGMTNKTENGNSGVQSFKTMLKFEVTFVENESKKWLEKDSSTRE